MFESGCCDECMFAVGGLFLEVPYMVMSYLYVGYHGRDVSLPICFGRLHDFIFFIRSSFGYDAS